jgi:hypothetical protein
MQLARPPMPQALMVRWALKQLLAQQRVQH